MMYPCLSFAARLALILEADHPDFRAAVGIVQSGPRFLLGLARDTGDDRSGRWVFPGGHLRRGESPKAGAVREVREETGVQCRASGDVIVLPRKPDVAFVPCRARLGQSLKNNHEFSGLGFFTRQEMRHLRLYPNVLQLLDRL